MPEDNKANSNESVQAKKDRKDSQRGLWIIIGVGAVILLAVVAVGSFFVDSQKIRFITEFSLTVALATLVGVQAYIYKRQWEAMERQGTQIERQAEYTAQSLKSDRRHTIYTLRAYVNIASCLADFPEQIILEIKNFGQTPAHKVQFCSTITPGPSNDPPEAFVETLDWNLPGASFPPTMSIEKRLKIRTLSEKEIELLNDGQYRLYVVGAIRYEDIFRRVRYTRFSLYYSLPGRQLGTNLEGNDAN
jgi:hypothetical protein